MICVDEMGPVSARSCPARRPTPQGERPHLAPDYGRRSNIWVLGGFEAHTDIAFTQVADKRDTQNIVAFLDALVALWPEGEIILILDNLSTHGTLDVRLWTLAHERVRFLFQPVYTPWVN